MTLDLFLFKIILNVASFLCALVPLLLALLWGVDYVRKKIW